MRWPVTAPVWSSSGGAIITITTGITIGITIIVIVVIVQIVQLVQVGARKQGLVHPHARCRRLTASLRSSSRSKLRSAFAAASAEAA